MTTALLWEDLMRKKGQKGCFSEKSGVWGFLGSKGGFGWKQDKKDSHVCAKDSER